MFYGPIIATEHRRGDLHKSKVLVIASTLLLPQVKNIYQNTTKIHKRWNEAQVLKTLFLIENLYLFHHYWYPNWYAGLPNGLDTVLNLNIVKMCKCWNRGQSMNDLKKTLFLAMGCALAPPQKICRWTKCVQCH